MLRKQETIIKFDSPEVIDERNRRIAALVAKKIGYSEEKARDLFCTLNILTKDSTPQKLLEYLYEKLWPVQSGVKREDIQGAITKCHEDAIVWLQNTQQNMRDN